jgi:hypothetical protein
MKIPIFIDCLTVWPAPRKDRPGLKTDQISCSSFIVRRIAMSLPSKRGCNPNVRPTQSLQKCFSANGWIGIVCSRAHQFDDKWLVTIALMIAPPPFEKMSANKTTN